MSLSNSHSGTSLSSFMSPKTGLEDGRTIFLFLQGAFVWFCRLPDRDGGLGMQIIEFNKAIKTFYL